MSFRDWSRASRVTSKPKSKTAMQNQLSSIIGGIVRHGLGVVAGGAITNGFVTGAQLEVVSGAVTALLVVAWSIWQKSRAAK